MKANDPGLIIHGHFYQPPRENPWTGAIDSEPGAAPFADWNERVFSECYRPNAFAEILDDSGRVLKIVNNYAHINFNVGPTLFSWLEKFHPDVYARILEADRQSAKTYGTHGNAIAQAYAHPILPLCRERDARTQIHWGLVDFEHRFGRKAEALWLPETAANHAVLGYLIDEGLKYVILSPLQAEAARKTKTSEWKDVSGGKIDTSIPYRFLHPDGSGRSIAVFFYNAAVSKAIAFEGVLISSKKLLDRFEQELNGAGNFISAATDGESYGHHFRYGERCLAYALETEAPGRGFRLTNYGEYLAQNPPDIEVRLSKGEDGKGTSWSCPHGVARWFRDCGCEVGAKTGWNQAWRSPLREALDFLNTEAAKAFEEEARALFANPWKTRDAYIKVLLEPQGTCDFFKSESRRALGEKEKRKTLAFLEMQRHCLLMYASCGWFFADISGLEAVLILKQAGRVLDYFDELKLKSPLKRFMEILAEAKSNLPEMGTGADVFRNQVKNTYR
jgi:alpha-amylase/alpha-mannosidase (GH57 family)